MLAARELTRRFGGLVAVDRVSLELKRGEIHALIGTNGAGKSTLINLLAGQLRPSAGTVSFRGEPLRAARPERMARLGGVFDVRSAKKGGTRILIEAPRKPSS